MLPAVAASSAAIGVLLSRHPDFCSPVIPTAWTLAMEPEEEREAYAKMTPEQWEELTRKLDEYMEQLESRRQKYMDGWSGKNWEEMESHPFFAKGIEYTKELSPLLKGIQNLKYSLDKNTPEDLAKNYKEDSNFNFQAKKYRLAVLSYTEGLRQKCGQRELETQLLTNRAVAHFHLGNMVSRNNDDFDCIYDTKP